MTNLQICAWLKTSPLLQTYRFVIEGGNSENPAESHPFYITSSHEGGYGQKQSWERDQERVFAGVRTVPGGIVEPTGRKSTRRVS
jgi:hypothetical protein